MKYNALKTTVINVDICKASWDTYESARGFDLGRHSGMASASVLESSEREGFPFLDASASRSVEAPLFFPPP